MQRCGQTHTERGGEGNNLSRLLVTAMYNLSIWVTYKLWTPNGITCNWYQSAYGVPRDQYVARCLSRKISVEYQVLISGDQYLVLISGDQYLAPCCFFCIPPTLPCWSSPTVFKCICMLTTLKYVASVRRRQQISCGDVANGDLRLPDHIGKYCRTWDCSTGQNGRPD